MNTKQRTAVTKRNKKRATSLRNVIRGARAAVAAAPRSNGDLEPLIEQALAAVKGKRVRFLSKKKTESGERVLPIPKTGGVIPLVPIMAGLAALGTVAKTTSAVANAVKDVNEARKSFKQGTGYHQQIGRGLYLRPYKDGYGLVISNDVAAISSEASKKGKKEEAKRKKKISTPRKRLEI